MQKSNFATEITKYGGKTLVCYWPICDWPLEFVELSVQEVFALFHQKKLDFGGLQRDQILELSDVLARFGYLRSQIYTILFLFFFISSDFICEILIQRLEIRENWKCYGRTKPRLRNPSFNFPRGLVGLKFIGEIKFLWLPIFSKKSVWDFIRAGRCRRSAFPKQSDFTERSSNSLRMHVIFIFKYNLKYFTKYFHCEISIFTLWWDFYPKCMFLSILCASSAMFSLISCIFWSTADPESSTEKMKRQVRNEVREILLF